MESKETDNQIRIAEVKNYMALCGISGWKEIKDYGDYPKTTVFISQMMSGEKPMSKDNYVELMNAISRARGKKG